MIDKILKYLSAAVIGSALIFQPEPSVAQDADADIICVLPLRLWMGSASETAAINEKPVPDSFHRLHTIEGDCGSGLNRPSLFEWHERYGSEKSSLAARHYFQTTPPHIPKFSFSTLWRKSDTKAWRRSLEDTVTRLDQAIARKDQRSTHRISGELYNEISHLLRLGKHADNGLNMAETFNSETWLGHASENIKTLEKSLKYFDQLTRSYSKELLDEAVLVRQNLHYILVRAQARASLMAAYLGDEDSLGKARIYLADAYDPAYDKLIDVMDNYEIKQCEGFSDEDLKDSVLAAFCLRLEHNGGLELAKAAYLYFAMVYRAEILETHYSEENVDKIKLRWGNSETGYKFLITKTALDALGELQDHTVNSVRPIGIAASWNAHGVLSNITDQSIWDLQARLSELHGAIDVVSSSEWPSLWERLARQYLEMDAIYQALALEKKEVEIPVEYQLRAQLIKAQLSVLDSTMRGVSE